MSSERVLPHDLAAEAGVLGGILLAGQIPEALASLEAEAFYHLPHRWVFAAMRELEAAGKPVDTLTVEARIADADRAHGAHRLEQMGGTAFLVRLSLEVPIASNVVHYADRLRLLQRNRRVIAELAAAAERAHAWPHEPEELLSETVGQLQRIEQQSGADVRAPGRWLERDFQPMPARVVGERAERAHQADHALTYQLRFLDDCIRAILPHDLVLIGAPTGAGKTDLALAIANANASLGRRVAYFALEAEPRELERRTKFSRLSLLAYERNVYDKHKLNYTDWLLRRCDHIVGELEAEVDAWFTAERSTLRTFYRGMHFDAGDLRGAIEFVHAEVDVIFVDHLHYVDANEDQDEHRALGETVKTIRDVSLRVGKPIVLVAHLRKRDPRTRQLVPQLDDFHGSSNITKIATQVITIERASCIEAEKWWLSPTFMSVLKDRRAGTTGLVALTQFDRRSRTYADEYTLGRLIKGGSEWEPIKAAEQPGWATGHRQLEMEV